MPGLVIDYNLVKTQKCNILLDKLGKTPSISPSSSLVILLRIPTEQINKFHKLSKTQFQYLNSSDFVNAIQTHCFAVYDKKRKVCMIHGNIATYLLDILSSMRKDFPSNTLLWVSLPLKDSLFIKTLTTYANNGFNNPYISKETPLGKKEIIIGLSRINSNIEIDATGTLNDTLYTLQQFKKSVKSECNIVGSCGTCSVYAQLTKDAIEFLRRASKTGIKVNGGNGKDLHGNLGHKDSHNELTAELYVKTVVKKDNNFVYIIDVDEQTLVEGREENVDVSPTRYNFHSHPHTAYVRHAVHKAWPSLTDYLGYLTLGNNTIFHCVATIEGIYVMSFGPYWVKNLSNTRKKSLRDFISKNFDISHKEPHTPEEYVQIVNKILYEKHPIFYIQYFPWKKANTIFQVSFSKTGLNCLATEKGRRTFQKLHR